MTKLILWKCHSNNRSFTIHLEHKFWFRQYNLRYCAWCVFWIRTFEIMLYQMYTQSAYYLMTIVCLRYCIILLSSWLMIAPCRLLGIINCNNTLGVNYRNQSHVWRQVGAWLINVGISIWLIMMSGHYTLCHKWAQVSHRTYATDRHVYDADHSNDLPPARPPIFLQHFTKSSLPVDLSQLIV